MIWVSKNKYNWVAISSKRQQKYQMGVLVDLPTQYQYLDLSKGQGLDRNLEGKSSK